MAPERMPENLHKQLRDETALADAGEAMGVFLHELGNVLNNLLLDARLMQRQLAEPQHARLAESCRLIAETAGHMNQLAQYRNMCRPELQLLDVNALVAEMVAQLFPDTKGVVMDLQEDLPEVTAAVVDMKRLVRMLCRNASAAAQKKPIFVRTRTDGDDVLLLVECDGPRVKPERAPLLFEPFQSTFSAWNSLELAICRNLVRRMNGRIEALGRPQGGVTLSVTLLRN